MWHLTQTLNYADETETETSLEFNTRLDLDDHLNRLVSRVGDQKISSVVLVLLYK